MFSCGNEQASHTTFNGIVDIVSLELLRLFLGSYHDKFDQSPLTIPVADVTLDLITCRSTVNMISLLNSIPNAIKVDSLLQGYRRTLFSF